MKAKSSIITHSFYYRYEKPLLSITIHIQNNPPLQLNQQRQNV